jgi:valyl-tRNA synthetase
MDTWATSAVSPQIAGRWLEDDELFRKVFPMSLRPHAHEIIRTWTFYTIVKSLYHFGQLPWSNIAISGFGLAAEGAGKISKSKGGGPLDPIDMMKRYSADAVRYWAASTGLGRDSVVSEEKIAVGNRLVTKLWNAACFTLRFLEGYQPPQTAPALLPADRWILSRLQHVIQKAKAGFEDYDYVSAKDEVESFFWNVMTDNYLEMIKARLYELDDGDFRKEAAKYTLHNVLLAVIKMFAPIMPHITEEIFQFHFVQHEAVPSIHISKWPEASHELISDSAEALGDALVGIATEVRRYKTTNRLQMGAPLSHLYVSSSRQELLSDLRASALDLRSVTRAQDIDFSDTRALQASVVPGVKDLWMTIEG